MEDHTEVSGAGAPPVVLVAGTWTVQAVAGEAQKVLTEAARRHGSRQRFVAAGDGESGAVSSILAAGSWPEDLRGAAAVGVLLASPLEDPALALAGAWSGSWSTWSVGEVPSHWVVLYVDLEGTHRRNAQVFADTPTADVWPVGRRLIRRGGQDYRWPENLLSLLLDPDRRVATPEPPAYDLAG